MLKYITSILFILSTIGVLGQTFNARIGNNSLLGNYLQGIGTQSIYVDEADSSILMATGANGSWKELTVRRFSNGLNLIDSTFFSFQVSAFIHTRPHSFRQVNANRSALLVDFYDTANYTKFFLLNNALDTVKSTTIKSDTIWRVYSYDFLVEDSTLTVVSQLNRHLYNDQQLLITQYDTALNLLWQSTIPDWRSQQGGYFPARIMRLHDTYYISGRCVYPNWVESFLVKTDLSGQKIWDERYRIPNESAATFTLDAFNDTLVLVHGISTTGIEKRIWITQLDTAGALLRDTIYPLEEGLLIPNDMVQTNTGEFVTVGYYKTDATGLFNGFMIKFDRDLTILWHRSYYHKSSFDENQLWRIHQWPDGNLLATGSLEWWDNRPPHVPHDHVWLLSLDSNGCLAANNCGVLAVPEEEFWPQQTGALQLYPNPATTAVTLNLVGLNGQANVSLYNLQGQKMHVQSLEFTQGQATLTFPTDLPTGAYFLTLKTKTDAYTTKLVVIQ